VSPSTSRTLPESLLSHPSVKRLITQGQRDGHVSPQHIRETCDEADVTAAQRKALLKHLSAEGVTVAVGADETTGSRKRVAAATASRAAVSTSKKAAAKKTSPKKAAGKSTTSKSTAKAPAKKAASVTKTSSRSTAEKPAAKSAAKPAAKKADPKAKPAAKPEAKSDAKTAKTAKAPAKKAAAKKGAKAESADKVEPAVEIPAAAVLAEAEVDADGKKTLADIDDSVFEKDLATDPTLKEDEKEGFTISEADEADEPEQTVTVAGATADPVKDYQIGRASCRERV